MIKHRSNLFLGIGVLLIAALMVGCETGKNYQSDMDSMNSRIASLQSQISAKDDEIAKLRATQSQIASKNDEMNQLQKQLNDQQAALARSESERKALADRLDSALAKAAQKPKSYDSDLK